MALHPVQSQQFVLKPKYYHPHHTHPQHQPDRPIPLTGGHSPLHGNHTGRIKVVFTPTICKVTCMGGRCQNNCELGNTTTIISENGHATDTLTAPNFRVVVCHLPCINGGKCSARDKCQCPASFTGKFCQMAVQNGQHQRNQQTTQVHSSHTLRQQQTAQVHSTHTLPLTFSNGHNPVKYSPSIVNIHVKHPPEASVQIHQVSQLDANGQKLTSSSQSSQSGSHYTTYHHSESSQTQTQTHHHQQQGHNVIFPSQHGYVPQYQPVSAKSQLGRCFQETAGTQCGKALPGLRKQEDCCGTFGTSWGFNKCQKCPKKPSIPLTGTRHAMDCPQGYKRINSTHCLEVNECQVNPLICGPGVCYNTAKGYTCICDQGYQLDDTDTTCIDLNECQLQGVCPNGECVNTMGSYRCSCKAGYIPDPTLSTCIQKGACFRLVSSGRQCLHPVAVQLSRQLCCCSVGKAWGPRCDPCPLPGTAKFKEICPGGMGYTVLPKPPNRIQPANKPVITYQEPLAAPIPLPTPEKPVEALSVTERQLPAVPEVVEKTSPPAPVEILPSNAGQDIAPTQFEEVNECQVNPLICGPGLCYNTAKGYTCICDQGFQLDDTDTTCIDVDECAESRSLCSNGRCRNTAGSFMCVCQPGFITDEEGTSCIDVDECANPFMCPEDSLCVNLLGSYSCRRCDAGYRMSPEGQCEDVDECLEPSTCANGRCSNFQGYFVCSCDDGFTLSVDGQSCEDVDECQDEQVCTRGHCQNTQGSFLCSCGPGFRSSATGDQCDDVDECAELTAPCESVGQCVNNMGSYQCICPQGYLQVNGTTCEDVDECVDDPDLCLPHGECLNVQGSFHCLCQPGFVASETHTCDDIDECLEGGRCVGGSCENSQGSYRCQCDRGYRLQADNHTCQDIDECAADESVCGNHGYCENTAGSFRCMCDSGYEESQERQGCVDVNECELFSSVCGEALCQNVEGAFMCVCPEEDQVYDETTSRCSPPPAASGRKECYYNLNDENLCENVLTSHVTIEECCCTLGAGWGDNCEVHPCPVLGTDQFKQMCPAGQGSVPSVDSALRLTGYQDADECALYGEEICKDGFCLNNPGSYECYCKTGLYYDEVTLQCRDINECMDESNCLGGECLNLEGSYTCVCPHPKVLDPENKWCMWPDTAVSQEMADIQGICWQTVTDTETCTKPLANRKTTYLECCCLYGEAWGSQCARCPPKSEPCPEPKWLHRRVVPHRAYGRDALVAGEVHEYEESPAYGRYEEEETDPFEGLRAEECGILNGCENGWCVRVPEGYTCDCFDGFSLDTARMLCLDVNECSELNSRMSLCKNAKCINTQGSYKCVCLPGFQPSDRPNYCVPGEQEAAAAAKQWE